MKFSPLLPALVLFTTVVTNSFADDSLTGASAKKGASNKPAFEPAIKKSLSTEPADRELELRAGPRFSLLDGSVRRGVNGSKFGVQKSVGLKGVNTGVKFDADWQPFNRWHFNYGMTWDQYKQSGTTQKDIIYGDETFLQGGTVAIDANLYSFEGKLGYDLIKNSTYRLQPYIAGKGGYVDGSITFSGRRNISSGGTLSTDTAKRTGNVGFATFIGGVDQRIYVTHDWYLGLDAAAFGGSAWTYVTGDVYTGFDFSKNWGLRAGYSADFADYMNPKNRSAALALYNAVYLQMVWGF